MPAGYYYVGGNLGLGTETNPQGPVVVSLNAQTGIALPVPAQGVYFFGADNQNAAFTAVSWGGTAQVNLVSAGGPIAAPAFPAANGVLGANNYYGYGGSSGYVPALSFRARAQALWTPTSTPSYMEWRTVPPASAAFSVVMCLGRGLMVGGNSPATAGADPGLGRVAMQPLTVASLPAASAALAGSFGVVSDATSTVPGGAVVGGGTHTVAVFCNGAAWLVFIG
jgi:hypothetical protein